MYSSRTYLARAHTLLQCLDLDAPPQDLCQAFDNDVTVAIQDLAEVRDSLDEWLEVCEIRFVGRKREHHAGNYPRL